MGARTCNCRSACCRASGRRHCKLPAAFRCIIPAFVGASWWVLCMVPCQQSIKHELHCWPGSMTPTPAFRGRLRRGAATGCCHSGTEVSFGSSIICYIANLRKSVGTRRSPLAPPNKPSSCLRQAPHLSIGDPDQEIEITNFNFIRCPARYGRSFRTCELAFRTMVHGNHVHLIRMTG